VGGDTYQGGGSGSRGEVLSAEEVSVDWQTFQNGSRGVGGASCIFLKSRRGNSQIFYRSSLIFLLNEVLNIFSFELGLLLIVLKLCERKKFK
jgi:hypothetical protein